MRTWVRWMLAGGCALGAIGPAGVAGAGGGGCHRPVADGAPEAGAVVELRKGCFAPTVLRLERGSPVRFVNRDHTSHLVLGTGWGSPELIEPGQSVEFSLSEPGVHPYSCYLHPGMNGAVVVGDQAAVRPVALEPGGKGAQGDGQRSVPVAVPASKVSPETRSAPSWWILVAAAALLAPPAFVLGRRTGGWRRDPEPE